VEYLIRQARITDVDRLYALCAQLGLVPGGDSPVDAIGLLRQLVYIPTASVVVAEAGHQIVGGAVLALRPSVRVGGFIGTIDLLAVVDGPEKTTIVDLLIEEMVHSARRKGCTSVEVAMPPDADNMSSWQDHGFVKTTAGLHRASIALRAQTGR